MFVLYLFCFFNSQNLLKNWLCIHMHDWNHFFCSLKRCAALFLAIIIPSVWKHPSTYRCAFLWVRFHIAFRAAYQITRTIVWFRYLVSNSVSVVFLRARLFVTNVYPDSCQQLMHFQNFYFKLILLQFVVAMNQKLRMVSSQFESITHLL